MLDQQQALAVLGAIESQDIAEFWALLPFDARQDFDLSLIDRGVVTVAVIGDLGVAYSEGAGLHVHRHPDAETAYGCYQGKIEEMADVARQASFLPMFSEIDALPETGQHRRYV